MSDFMSKSTFEKQVIENVTHKGLSILEGIKFVCDKNDIDPEDSKKFINENLKRLLEIESKQKNLLKG